MSKPVDRSRVVGVLEHDEACICPDCETHPFGWCGGPRCHCDCPPFCTGNAPDCLRERQRLNPDDSYPLGYRYGRLSNARGPEGPR